MSHRRPLLVLAILGVLLFPHPNALAGPVPSNDDPFQKAQAELDELNTLTGTATAVSGAALIRKVKTFEWRAIVDQESIVLGDHIRTGADGQVKIEFSNGNNLFIKPDSDLSVGDLRIDPKSGKYVSVFEVIKASIKAEVNNHADLKKFEVKTPTATVGVRGTILYVNAALDFTRVFVERGMALLHNDRSGEERQINPGFVAQSDEHGEVSQPAEAPPEMQQEFQANWEPGSMPPNPADQSGEGGPGQPGEGAPKPPGEGEEAPPKPPLMPPTNSFLPPLDIYQQQNNFTQAQRDAFRDRQLSQEANKTEYISTGSTLPGDNDGDGIPNNIDPDDDNDFLPDNEEINLTHTSVLNRDSDNDGLTDWDEARIQHSSPLSPDSDSDGVSDLVDVFPNLNSLTGSRAAIRTKRYDQVATISGLRSEITAMLSDTAERQKDFLMDRISDAQTHKVLKDHSGNWVRTEEYVFRPTPQAVDVQVISYSPAAGGWTSMLWSTNFANSLSGLTSPQIRDLPWEKFLSATPNYGTTFPSNYPTQMTVLFEHQGSPDSFKDIRGFGSPTFSSFWTQGVTQGMSVNGGTVTGYTVNPGTPNSNPYSFNYTSTVYFDIYVIDDNANLQGTRTYTDLFSVLGTNLPGFNAIGNNNVDIRISFNSHAWDVIYVPIRSLTWRGTADWVTDPLNW